MPHHDVSVLVLVLLAGLWAGIQNTLAGGGSFITFPALLLAGLNPLSANITSTIALFPNQITSATQGRKLAGGVGKLSLPLLFAISIVGGIVGAMLLLETPVSIFSHLVPWLVMFATLMFAWGTFRKKPMHAAHHVSYPFMALVQFVIGVYGGYFGGGIGILMLAALTIAGQQTLMATATKNILAMAMNSSAFIIFLFSDKIDWSCAFALAIGGIAGGFAGGWLMHKLPEKALRIFVIGIGTFLTYWLFTRH